MMKKQRNICSKIGTQKKESHCLIAKSEAKSTTNLHE